MLVHDAVLINGDCDHYLALKTGSKPSSIGFTVFGSQITSPWQRSCPVGMKLQQALDSAQRAASPSSSAPFFVSVFPPHHLRDSVGNCDDDAA